jgi:ferrous iron transport protein B
MLVGNPNVGKSTLFNLLTGARQKTMNAPRTTVAFESGRWRLRSTDPAAPATVRLIDLPGTYSLLAQSPDEQVTAEAVSPAAIPATSSSGSSASLGATGRAKNQGHKHSSATACPHCGAKSAAAKDGHLVGAGRAESGRETDGLSGPDLAIAMLDANAPASSLYLIGQLALLGVPLIVAVTMADVARSRGVLVDTAQLRDVLGVPVVEVDPRRGKGGERLAETVAAVLAGKISPRVKLPLEAEICGLDDKPDLDLASDPLFDWVAETIAAASLDRPPTPAGSDKVDRWLLKWWIGTPVFLAILWLVFEATTVLAGPLQEAFEGFVVNVMGGWVQAGLNLIGWDGGWFESLLQDGLLAGVGIVAGFVPLMAIIFLAIALLEDSGYMARAALVSDRLMRLIGLDGRAVLPLVIGFGCNIPAVAATKTLPDARQRLMTGLMAPYASCTARLVIFLFIASVFFPEHAGSVVFGMYLISAGLIVLVGLVLHKTAFRSVGDQPLILVLPPYQVPRLMPLFRSVVLRCRNFVLRAGQVIVVLSIVVWGLLSIPVTAGYTVGDEIPAQDSLLGAVAEGIAPVFAPAGFDDWHVTASLMTGFVAKEAAVGTMATSFGMEEPEDPTQVGDLSSKVRAALDASSGGHGNAAAWAYMLFCLGYAPCMATVAEQRRVFGLKPTAAALGLSLAISWLLAVVVFQLGALL